MEKINKRTFFCECVKLIVLAVSCLCISSLSGLCEEFSEITKAEVRKGPIRDVIEEKALRQLARDAAKLQERVASQSVPLLERVPSTEGSLGMASIFIIDEKFYTIIPIGSVLSLPGKLRARVVTKPEGVLLLWPDFLARNSDWLGTKEVSLAMSRGDVKAAAVVMHDLAADGRMFVAVYRGCPITILEPVPPRSGAKSE